MAQQSCPAITKHYLFSYQQAKLSKKPKRHRGSFACGFLFAFVLVLFFTVSPFSSLAGNFLTKTSATTTPPLPSFTVSPKNESPEPGKITRLRFWLLEAFINPESAAAPLTNSAATTASASASAIPTSTPTPTNTPSAAKAKLHSPTATTPDASLRVIYTGIFPVPGLDRLRAEIQNKFPTDYTRILKHGTFLLTWSENDLKKRENAKKPKSPTPVDQEPQQPKGFFYDETEARAFPQTGFFTADGRKHWVTLLNPSPENPPALQLQLCIHPSTYPLGEEPIIDSEKPETLEFSATLDFPESGYLVVGLLAADNTAYFCCFRTDLVNQEADLSPFRLRLLHKVDPTYPRPALQKKLQGTVRLECKTDADGNVSHIRVLEAPHPLLAAEAVNTVKKWIYSPPQFEGRKYPIAFIATMTFKAKPGPMIIDAPIIISK
ncbi:MAG: energy transducer TonB [Candidatus Saccharicenans sp.]